METKVEIIMTTYNGEKFIRQQLESIFNQDYKDMIVNIYDDGSTDATETIVLSFIKDNKVDNWKFIKNKYNLGWKKNFINALKSSTAEFVFFCDQDDIWQNNHVSHMLSLLEINKKINVLCSNYKIIDAQNNIIDNKKDFKFDNSLEKIKLSPRNFEVKRPGCSYGIRVSFFLKYLSLWTDEWAHDEFVWSIGLITNSLYMSNFESLKYRRHGNNSSGSVRSRVELNQNLKNRDKLIDTLFQINIDDCHTNYNSAQILKKVKKFNNYRMRAFTNTNISNFFTYPFFFTYFPSWKHFLLEYKNLVVLRR